METKKTENEQIPIEAIVVAHEMLENGTKLVLIAPEMESVPRKVKLIW